MKGELRPPSAPGIAKPFPDPSVKALQALILWITLQDSQVRLYPHLCCPSIRRYLANYRVTSEITGTLSFPSSMFSLVLKNLGFTHPDIPYYPVLYLYVRRYSNLSFPHRFGPSSFLFQGALRCLSTAPSSTGRLTFPWSSSSLSPAPTPQTCHHAFGKAPAFSPGLNGQPRPLRRP